jgi:biopolymer transport protein ExbD
MAGIDIGSGASKKRSINSEVNMIPFIDLMMVTIAFLLITAVWVNRSQISADAQVPGQSGCGDEGCSRPVEKSLHVHLGEKDFELVWKQAGTVVSETRIPRSKLDVGDGSTATMRFPDLARVVEKEWAAQGLHSDPSDRRQDQAILHTDDRTPYRELVAVMDAIHNTQRDLRKPDGATAKIPAFNLVFATR